MDLACWKSIKVVLLLEGVDRIFCSLANNSFFEVKRGLKCYKNSSLSSGSPISMRWFEDVCQASGGRSGYIFVVTTLLNFLRGDLFDELIQTLVKLYYNECSN
jgi:hypothetical protein